MNYDGNFVFGLVLLPLFLYELISNMDTYTQKDILISNLSFFALNIAVNCFGQAMKYGKGGPV